MPRLKLTDLTLRDAHQSLFATRLTTADMLPVAPAFDRVGFWSLETWGGATFDTCLRFLNEDPWARLRALKAAMPRTPMQMLLRGQNLLGYRHYADDVVDAFVECAARNGVDVFRVFDALNDPRNLERALRAVKKAGRHAQAAVSYALSPVHTVESYVKLVVELRERGADSICIKDMAGLLKPYEAVALTRAIKQRVGLPLQIHSHATTGMSIATLVKAAEAGADLLDTAISSMAMGTSHSPTETIVEIFQGTEFDTGLDPALLEEIAAHFRAVRPKYRAFESAFVGADTRILISQVPGGMLSNLESQLKEQGALDKIDAVLGEIAVVQKDFGYPPLVTPTSQIVGTQAVMNVMFGRYQRLTNESRALLTGQYGATPAGPDADLVRTALREAKLADPVTERPADRLPVEMPRIEAELREKTGQSSVSREDVLSYAMFPQVALAFFRTRDKGPVQFKPAEEQPAPKRGGGRYRVKVDGDTFTVAQSTDSSGKVTVSVDGQSYAIEVHDAPEQAAPHAEPGPAAGGGPGTTVLAPMPGTVVELSCPEGARVEANQTILVMEALKMQMEIKSTAAGAVHYRVAAGAAVRPKAVLAEIR